MFDIGLSEALNAMNKKQWKVYCPACYTGAYFRFEFGASLLVSVAFVASLAWVLDLPSGLAFVVYFPSFVLAGLTVTLVSPLVTDSFEKTQYDRKTKGSSGPTNPSTGPAA